MESSTIKFNLKEGMTDSLIYNELHGKIQGESTQQVQDFLYPSNLNNKDIPRPLHIILKSNNEYALIRKNSSFITAKQYYLSGINDEGTYFVHELPTIKDIENIELEHIVNDVNLGDYEFERIQGDILVKFFSFETIVRQERDYKISRRKFYQKKQQLIDIYPWVFTPDQDTHIQYGITTGFRQFFETWKTTMKIYNNHIITVQNGRLYEQAHHRQFAVMGESFTLKHNQHESRTINIPKRHYAVITTQKAPLQNMGVD